MHCLHCVYALSSLPYAFSSLPVCLVFTACMPCLHCLMPCLHCLYDLSSLRVCLVFTACMPCLHCVYALSSLPVCLASLPVCLVFTACMPCLRCVYALSSLPVCIVFTACMPCLHCLYALQMDYDLGIPFSLHEATINASVSNVSETDADVLEPEIANVNDAYFDKQVRIAVLYIEICVGLFGGGFVCLWLWTNPRRKSRVNLVITHLTVSDLLVITCAMLPQLVWEYDRQWRAGWLGCKLLKFTQVRCIHNEPRTRSLTHTHARTRTHARTHTHTHLICDGLNNRIQRLVNPSHYVITSFWLLFTFIRALIN